MGNSGLATGVQTQGAWQRFLRCVVLPFLLSLTCSSDGGVGAVPGSCEESRERGGHRQSNEKLQSALPVKTKGSEQLY